MFISDSWPTDFFKGFSPMKKREFFREKVIDSKWSFHEAVRPFNKRSTVISKTKEFSNSSEGFFNLQKQLIETLRFLAHIVFS